MNRISAGTDDGLIHTHQPTAARIERRYAAANFRLAERSQLIDAGHFDANIVYAAVNTIRLDDMRPHIYRTYDGGKTWNEIVKGIPAPKKKTVNVVSEDIAQSVPLVGAGRNGPSTSRTTVKTGKPLRLNTPSTSVRDLIIKDDDIAVATHGRGFGFWITSRHCVSW